MLTVLMLGAVGRLAPSSIAASGDREEVSRPNSCATWLRLLRIVSRVPSFDFSSLGISPKYFRNAASRDGHSPLVSGSVGLSPACSWYLVRTKPSIFLGNPGVSAGSDAIASVATAVK